MYHLSYFMWQNSTTVPLQAKLKSNLSLNILSMSNKDGEIKFVFHFEKVHWNGSQVYAVKSHKLTMSCLIIYIWRFVVIWINVTWYWRKILSVCWHVIGAVCFGTFYFMNMLCRTDKMCLVKSWSVLFFYWTEIEKYM